MPSPPIPLAVAHYTARGNLVGVISNGTAVLGLGNIGPLASKPVMEGKAVLFKKFAGIDVFDIEIDADRHRHGSATCIAALEPTFGGINLEDIKAPECFEIERELRARMNIPVFHDDQHGTAIIVGGGGAERPGTRRQDDRRGQDRHLRRGRRGACLPQPSGQRLAPSVENIWVTDIDGVVYEGREDVMDQWKAIFAKKTDQRTLADVIDGADVFLGLSAAGVLKPETGSAHGRQAR